VNLVINAMDAMAETPPGRRRVTDREPKQGRPCREVSVSGALERVCRRSIERHAVHAIRRRRKRRASG
jgi:hypothetical protein